MYPSDYGYATGGGNYKREYCLSQNLASWNNYTECYKDDWLYISADHQWTITPVATDVAYGVAIIDRTAFLNGSHASVARSVRPTVYLKSNVQILSGEGSSMDPFIFG